MYLILRKCRHLEAFLKSNLKTSGNLLYGRMLGPLMDQQLAGFNRVIFDQTKEITHSLAVRPALSLFHNVLDMEVFGQYNFSTKEWTLLPRLSWGISDNLKMSIGGQYFDGPANTRYELIAPVFNGGFLELRYTF